MNYTLDEWWASLTVLQKERIGGKIRQQPCPYPQCSYEWNALDEATKQKIHDHCTDEHGHILTEWTEGKPFSY